MESYPFSKYSGCGNDFIIFDTRSHSFPANRNLISRLCHRQRGIGADGLILLENSLSADCKMRIFNSDGTEAEMCGNGIRCLFKFIHDQKISSKALCRIETFSKILTVGFEKEDVAVEMGNPTDFRPSLSIYPWVVHHMNTGVPHAVIFCENIEHLNVNQIAPQIRFHSLFPKGANVNFACMNEDGIIDLRTYERGVEQETLACGTGATATALIAAALYDLKGSLSVKVRSGDILKIDFRKGEKNFSDVRLIGSAHFIFNGTISL